MKNIKYFGYFDEPNAPAKYDPKYTVPCLICLKPLIPTDIRTISLMGLNDNRSYFYRVHKTCHENLTEEEQNMYDSSLIDNL